MADTLDSRQLVEEYQELDEELSTVTIILPGSEVKDMQERHAILANLLKELKENCDADPAEDGIQLIPVDNFEEYTREYAEECGYLGLKVSIESHLRMLGEEINVISKWPFNHIDWKAAADELAEDWVEIEFEGVTYLCR